MLHNMAAIIRQIREWWTLDERSEIESIKEKKTLERLDRAISSLVIAANKHNDNRVK